MTSVSALPTASAEDESAALEYLHNADLTDGLPVVIPTRERVEAMMAGASYDADLVLGPVGPAGHAATVEAVAVSAVMAGCLPEHFPVVCAAVRAVCDPRFDLTEVQVTTHAVTPMLIVNGPARERCGVASGVGCFGPGNRANVTIGRAVRLVMMNIGGGRPGVADMATFGHPAKFGFCAAENEEGSPWEPLHVSLGWEYEQSTVTALATEGPHTVVCSFLAEDRVDEQPAMWVRIIAAAVGTLGANSTYHEEGAIAVVLNPVVAQELAKAGFSRPDLQRELVRLSRHRLGTLRQLAPALVEGGGADDQLGPDRDPSSILIFVAGGTSSYVMVCPTLGVGPHKNPAVTKEIEIDQACAVPYLYSD